jgi:2-iminobutanoate/2-iminopropanoate deaminase
MKQALATRNAPAAIGPYSQAVLAGGALFVSGQIALDPASGELVAGDIAQQTERTMQNLAAVLAAAGCTFDDVVRTTIYVVNLAHYGSVNEVYGRFFRPPYPSRSTVQVAALPRNAQVEIDAIAVPLANASGPSGSE